MVEIYNCFPSASLCKHQHWISPAILLAIWYCEILVSFYFYNSESYSITSKLWQFTYKYVGWCWSDCNSLWQLSSVTTLHCELLQIDNDLLNSLTPGIHKNTQGCDPQLCARSASFEEINKIVLPFQEAHWHQGQRIKAREKNKNRNRNCRRKRRLHKN